MSELVEERYLDALGTQRFVPEATREAFARYLAANDAPESYLGPAIVLVHDEPLAFVTTLPAESWQEYLTWIITLEDGGTHRDVVPLRDAPVIASSVVAEHTYDQRRIALPPLPLGYHRLVTECGPYGRADVALIVVPRTAYLPDEARTWGIAVQLYTVRSKHNWGIGDFGDLRRIVALAADAGARYVGLNPLHASHRNDPDAASPYAPTSRRFLNWLMIDVAALPEAQAPEVRAAIEDPELRAQLKRLRGVALVDYNGVAEVKDSILRRCFAHFAAETPGDPGFRAFVEEGGAVLERFAIFETLVERLGRDLASWPKPYRDPTTPDVRAFADAERPALEYSMYLQWRAAEQLARAAAEGAARGVALYRDLAVGVDASGADVWLAPENSVTQVSVGAPPDALNTAGQDWGLVPLDPQALARDGYAAFAALVRANMAEAGALRIDHVMSLARLFWIPRGEPSEDGAYVRYPLHDLLGIVALESVRARCVVVGEDLGTVPDGFRERMAAAHILSYRILFFERDADGNFIAPADYPVLALAATGTHDLPPLAAWLQGSDIDLREHLGLLAAENVPSARAQRDADRQRLIATLIGTGDLEPAEITERSIGVAAHRYLARSPARIVMLQLDDAIGEMEPVNVPGTSTTYPNWRRKLSLDFEAIARDSRFGDVCAALRSERPR
jgi:glycogen operon protein